jgi:CxxC-x17-CxxC domain-containing protein
MDDPTSRVIVPVAIVTGTLRLTGGPPDEELVKVAIESLSAQPVQGHRQGEFPFPAAMTAELTLRGVARGTAVFCESGDLLTSSGRDSAAAGEHLDSAWAIDLVLGHCHPFQWVARNERQEALPSDLPIQSRIEESQAVDCLREVDIRRLVRNMSPPKGRMDPEEYRSWKRSLEERADRVEAVSLARTTEVAIPIRHHEKGRVERWLIGADPPESLMAVLRQSVQQLLELKIKTRDLRLGFGRSPALQLLEGIDDFWEKSRWSTWKSVTKETRQLLASRGLDLCAEWSSSWTDPTESNSDVVDLEVCVGESVRQANLFRRVAAATRKHIVALTSFLNPKYTEWVAELLGTLPPGATLLLLYGHANDEDSRAREQTAAAYQALLAEQALPSVRVLVRPTTVRSHEKIVVNDDSWFMLGSWNLGSSFPHATYLEASIAGRSQSLATNLISLLSEEADEPSLALLRELQGSLTATEGRVGDPVRHRLEALHSLFQSILEEGVHEVRDWRKVREQLTALRDTLWTHFSSPKLELVRGDDIRDVLVEQVSSAGHSVMIATDRLNETGLDASLVQELRPGELRLRILWGLEDPAWRIDDKETLEELSAAKDVLHRILEVRKEFVRSSETPMANHAKFAIFDDNRILIGSDNFLAHGRERGSETSREVALMVEHPLLARYATAAVLLERPQLCFPFDIHARDKPWELFELVRRQVEALAADPSISDPHRAALVEFASESMFHEFTPNGSIKVDRSGRPIVTNPDLSRRWESVLQAFGKGRSPMYFEELCKQAHESGFLQLVREPDQGFSLYPLGKYPPLPARPNIARDPRGIGAGVQTFCRALESLEKEPFASVTETAALEATKRAHEWFAPSRWQMDDDRFLDFLVESGRIIRLTGGDCRRVRESERQELRRQRWTGAVVGEPNAVCRECHRPFHHPHYGKRAPGDNHPLPLSVCLDCRAILDARVGAAALRSDTLSPNVVRDPEARGSPATRVQGVLAPGSTVTASCSVCGTAVQLPFQPDGVRPVYCRAHLPKLRPDTAPTKSSGVRELHDAVCSTCGAAVKVPFIPIPGRPVYCRAHLPPRKNG